MTMIQSLSPKDFRRIHYLCTVLAANITLVPYGGVCLPLPPGCPEMRRFVECVLQRLSGQRVALYSSFAQIPPQDARAAAAECERILIEATGQRCWDAREVFASERPWSSPDASS